MKLEVEVHAVPGGVNGESRGRGVWFGEANIAMRRLRQSQTLQKAPFASDCGGHVM